MSVPGWAYLDVVVRSYIPFAGQSKVDHSVERQAEDIFNITRAQSFIGAEHQPPPPPTPTPSPPRDRITVTVTSTSVNAASPGSTDTPVLSSSERKTSPGAIAGGIIGGVVVLLLAALAVFLIRRRRRKGSAPPEVSVVGACNTLQPPQSPVSYDDSKHSSDGRPQTYAVRLSCAHCSDTETLMRGRSVSILQHTHSGSVMTARCSMLKCTAAHPHQHLQLLIFQTILLARRPTEASPKLCSDHSSRFSHHTYTSQILEFSEAEFKRDVVIYNDPFYRV